MGEMKFTHFILSGIEGGAWHRWSTPFRPLLPAGGAIQRHSCRPKLHCTPFLRLQCTLYSTDPLSRHTCFVSYYRPSRNRIGHCLSSNHMCTVFRPLLPKFLPFLS